MGGHGEVQVQQFLKVRTSLVLLLSAQYTQFALLLVLINCKCNIDY
jgi:hypothetical protein